MITNFCGRFESDFPLAFRWFGLKPIGYSVVESFDEGVSFSWRAYRNLGTGYTCANSVMGSFVNTVGTTFWASRLSLFSVACHGHCFAFTHGLLCPFGHPRPDCFSLGFLGLFANSTLPWAFY